MFVTLQDYDLCSCSSKGIPLPALCHNTPKVGAMPGSIQRIIEAQAFVAVVWFGPFPLPSPQCCGSVTWFSYGSGSADPCLWPIDPDPDPALFILDLQGTNKKLFFVLEVFLLITFLKVLLHLFSKRSLKTVGIKGFLTFFYCCQKNPDPDPGGPCWHILVWKGISGRTVQ
jgi:hypothetical protein